MMRRRLLWLATHSVLPPSALAFQSCRAISTAPFRATSLALGATPSDDEFTKSYHLQGTGRRSQVDLTTDTGHSIQTDVPKKMGGYDTAPQPVETLLAALIGCTQATAVFVGRQMEPRLLIDSLEFDIHARRDERGALELPITTTPTIPARVHTVEGTIRVHLKKGSLSESQLEILAEQTEARCPVANMMTASGCELNIQWIDGDLK